MRIEIRCKGEKIKELKKKYGLKKIKDFMRHADRIGNELFYYYLSKMFAKETVRTSQDAKNRINGSEFKPENKAILTEFIDRVNVSRSAADIIKAYKDEENGYGKAETNKILFMLSEIDVNYVTATKEDLKAFGDDGIPTPLELLKKLNQGE